MFPIIDKRETGINIRKIMDRQGLTAKDVQQYLELGCVQSVYIVGLMGLVCRQLIIYMH